MRNIALRLKFDGTNYSGWQRQANAPTVQQTLETRLAVICGDPVTLHGCSRTDAGVHANGYVCNFKTAAEIPADDLKRALNATLPPDIAVTEVWDADAEFNARFDAAGKTYVYKILNAPIREPFLRNYTHHIKIPLDVEKMAQAAAEFAGTHDFRAFTNAEGAANGSGTVREISQCEISRSEDVVTITVTGNSFLYNMARIIAGTLIYAGRGKIAPEDIGGIIASRDRTRAGITAPAKGLFLEKVYY